MAASTTIDVSQQKFWLEMQFDLTKGDIFKPDELEIHLAKNHFPDIVENDVVKKIKGSLFGLALGDALGAHAEFRPHEFMVNNKVTDMMGGGTWGLQAGQFTDDTSMALCLANSLIAKSGFDLYDQLVRYKWWYRHGYMSSTGNCFDIGAATRDSIEEFEKRQRRFAEDNGLAIDEMDSLKESARENFDVNCSKHGVAGNGALMRLCPVPLFFHKKPELAVKYSGDSARITHGDKKAIDACRYYGALIVAALNGDTKENIMSNDFYDKHKNWFGEEPLVDEVLNIARGSYKNKNGYEEGIRGRGYVIDTLEAALWAFWNDEGSFNKGALNAVNLGDDTDTTAAIYGQLAGAFYGYDKLPDDWLKVIYGRKFVDCVSQWIYSEGEKWFKKAVHASMGRPRSREPSVDRTYGPLYNSRPGSSSFDESMSGFPVARVFLKRHAIGTNGKLGQFYDAAKDQVEVTSANLSTICSSDPPKISFEVLEGEKFRNKNVLRHLDIDPQLCLSILSGLVQPKGIAAVLNYPFLFNTQTYGFYLTYRFWQTTELTPRTEPLTHRVNQATHIITSIQHGIDVVVLTKIPAERSISLKKSFHDLCRVLKNDQDLTAEMYDSYNDFQAFAYSNIDELNMQEKLGDICRKIYSTKSRNVHRPCTYTLHPINVVYTMATDQVKYIPIERNLLTKLEQYWNYWSMFEKKRQQCTRMSQSKDKNSDLDGSYQEIEERCQNIQKNYFDQRDRIRELIVAIRRNEKNPEDFEEYSMNETTLIKIRNDIDDLNHEVVLLERQIEFVRKLKHSSFNYWRAERHGIDQKETLNSIKSKLSKHSNKHFLLSNDTLNAQRRKELDENMSKMKKDIENKPNFELVYIDFTYSACELDDIIVIATDETHSSYKDDAAYPSTPASASSNPFGGSPENIPNILFIGAQGCGKSNLVNLLSNYKCLRPSNFTSTTTTTKPQILIPFQLSIDMGTHDPHVVLFGPPNPNEKYTTRDTSTTQLGKAYVVSLHCNTAIRIIDTPGFSRTSEQRQDQLMDIISATVLDPAEIKSVCVVMKATDKELQGYDSFITKLSNWFGYIPVEKMIFCITDYLSGAPASLKRDSLLIFYQRIYSLSFWTEPKPKLKIALFDSQFFAYLNTHRFRSEIYEQYEQSRQICEDGAKMLKEYIFEDKKADNFHNKLTRHEPIKTQITHLVRPILETIRNNYRNMLVLSKESNDKLIELRPHPLKHPSALCYGCPRPAQQYASLWILEDKLNEFHGDHTMCGCSIRIQEVFNYELRYAEVVRSTENINQFTKRNDKLLQCMVHFGLFLRRSSKSNEDLFFKVLNRMIKEERWIYDNYEYAFYNGELWGNLTTLRKSYLDQIANEYTSGSIDSMNNETLIKYINDVKQVESIRKQVEAFSVLK